MTAFGYLLPTFEDGDMVELGVRAEQAGFDSVWVPDSPFVYGLPDPLIVLAGLATATKRVKLGTGVMLGAMRQPVLFDGRNIWDGAKARAAGFTYYGVGRSA